MWLLEYLQGKSQEVINFFSYYYELVIDLINNFFARVYNVIRPFISSVWTNAVNLVNGTIVWLQDKITAAYNSLLALYNSVTAYIISTYNNVRAWAQGFFDWLYNKIYEIRNEITTWVLAQIAYVAALPAKAIAYLTQKYNELIASFSWIDDFIFHLQARIDYLYNNNPLSGIQKQIDDINLFLNNPLGFILAYLKPIFLTLIEYTIGYAIGSDFHTLPPFPAIGGELNSIALNTTNIIPPHIGKISKPLDVLLLSGHHFSSNHPAMDLSLAEGDNVYSVHDGKIVSVGHDIYQYGLYIIVVGSGIKTLYAHLSDINTLTNDDVLSGDLIAYGGSTGNSTGPHLHLELWLNGIHANPLLIM